MKLSDSILSELNCFKVRDTFHLLAVRQYICIFLKNYQHPGWKNLILAHFR